MIYYANPCEREDCRAMREVLNRPELDDFLLGVKLEAAHQLIRWGTAHDRCKGPEDWFWTVGFLAGKALQAQRVDDDGKFMHHLISTAAVLANWHYFASNPEVELPGVSALEPAQEAVAKALKNLKSIDVRLRIEELRKTVEGLAPPNAAREIKAMISRVEEVL
jgi:hypothetical protein